MSSSTSFDWNLVAALSAASTFALGALLSWRGGLRSSVTFKLVRFEFVAKGSKIDGSKLYLKNRGFHLENFKIRIERFTPISQLVTNTVAIDKNEIRFEQSNGNLLICIPAFPAGELVEIDLAGRYFFESFIKGGSNKYLVIESGAFLDKRGFSIFLAIVVSIIIFAILSSIHV